MSTPVAPENVEHLFRAMGEAVTNLSIELATGYACDVPDIVRAANLTLRFLCQFEGLPGFQKLTPSIEELRRQLSSLEVLDECLQPTASKVHRPLRLVRSDTGL